MLKIALTGGIGSGKTTISNHFASLGAPVIDTDLLARELVAPGQEALAEIIHVFGSQVVQPGGSLNRPALRDLVFDSPEQRKKLEAILHPKIREEMVRRLAELNNPYVIIVIPLLVETGQMSLADRVLVVDCSEERQITHVSSRDGISEQLIKKMLAAQSSRKARLALADDVIENNGDIQRLLVATEQLHEKYLRLAALL